MKEGRRKGRKEKKQTKQTKNISELKIACGLFYPIVAIAEHVFRFVAVKWKPGLTNSI